MADLTPHPWRAWRDAALTPAVDASLRDLLERLDREVRDKGPTCWSSGKCCQFESYGHRLYVTGLEIAWFLAQPTPETPEVPSEIVGGLPILTPSSGGEGGCPYQVAKRCTAHAIRPTGCRVFFCQQGTSDWQQDLYERYLASLRALHEQHQVTYRYMDWMAGLSEADQAIQTGDG